MTRRRFSLAAAGIAAAALLLAGCAGESPAPESSGGSDPIRVVVLGGLGAEGILADNSTTSVTAAKASVEAINAAGGILGRTVEIEVVDDTGDPTVAVTKLREIIADKKPTVVMNSGPSTVAEATLPILTQNEILSFNIGPTATSGDPGTNPYNFDLSPSAADYLEAFIPVIKERGFARIGILHDSSPYGTFFGETAASILDTEGLEVVGTQAYEATSLDMTPQIDALREASPDVVVLSAYGAPLGYILQGFEKLGWDVPIMGNTSVSATGLIAKEPPTGVLGTDQVSNLTMQVFQSTRFDPEATLVNDAVDTMLEVGEIRSSLILAYNYDTMFLLKAAAENVGSIDDIPALAAALTDPSVQEGAGTAILARYNFTEESHTPNAEPEEFVFISPSTLEDGQFH